MGQSKMENWQHRVHNRKKDTTQYVLDTTIHKQTQITSIRQEPDKGNMTEHS